MTDVVISIVSRVETDGESEQMEFVTEGRMMHSNGVYRLYYNTDDGSGSESTVLRAERDSVVIHRSGETQSHLTVRQGERCVGHYDVGVAGMMVGISGREVQIDMTDSGGRIFLEYSIDINSEHVSTNAVEVRVTSAT